LRCDLLGTLTLFILAAIVMWFTPVNGVQE
jgi:hypothetical protein